MDAALVVDVLGLVNNDGLIPTNPLGRVKCRNRLKVSRANQGFLSLQDVFVGSGHADLGFPCGFGGFLRGTIIQTLFAKKFDFRLDVRPALFTVGIQQIQKVFELLGVSPCDFKDADRARELLAHIRKPSLGLRHTVFFDTEGVNRFPHLRNDAVN